MQGNKTDEVFDILCDYYGMKTMCFYHIDYSDAIFSNGFIQAIEDGLIPDLGQEKTSSARFNGEYHHMISDDVCYNVYFKEI